MSLKGCCCHGVLVLYTLTRFMCWIDRAPKSDVEASSTTAKLALYFYRSLGCSYGPYTCPMVLSNFSPVVEARHLVCFLRTTVSTKSFCRITLHDAPKSSWNRTCQPSTFLYTSTWLVKTDYWTCLISSTSVRAIKCSDSSSRSCSVQLTLSSWCFDTT